jgi:hypothetical protein
VNSGNMQQVPVNSGNMRSQSAPVNSGNMQQVPVNAGSVGQSAPANNGSAQQHAVQQTLPVDSGAMHDRQSRAQTMSADRSKPSEVQGHSALNDRKAAFLDDSRPKLAETRRFAQTAPEPGAQSSLDDQAPGGGSRGPGLANTGENEARVAFERRQSEMDAAMDDAPDWAANGFGD